MGDNGGPGGKTLNNDLCPVQDNYFRTGLSMMLSTFGPINIAILIFFSFF